MGAGGHIRHLYLPGFHITRIIGVKERRLVSVRLVSRFDAGVSLYALEKFPRSGLYILGMKYNCNCLNLEIVVLVKAVEVARLQVVGRCLGYLPVLIPSVALEVMPWIALVVHLLSAPCLKWNFPLRVKLSLKVYRLRC